MKRKFNYQAGEDKLHLQPVNEYLMKPDRFEVQEDNN
jgi:hypothetical protein